MIERRHFLGMVGGTAVATAASLQFSSIASAGPLTSLTIGNRRYRTDGSSRLEVSVDNGPWELHTDFGPEYQVKQIYADAKQRVFTRLDFGGYRFNLRLGPDVKKWLTT